MQANPKLKIAQALIPVRRLLEDLHEEIVGFENYELTCWCGIAAYAGFVALKKHGFLPEYRQNQRHAFLKVEGYYVDLTIKQFERRDNREYPEIFVAKKPLSYWHKTGHKTENLTEVRKFFRDWPDEQNPFKLKDKNKHSLAKRLKYSYEPSR